MDILIDWQKDINLGTCAKKVKLEQCFLDGDTNGSNYQQILTEVLKEIAAVRAIRDNTMRNDTQRFYELTVNVYAIEHSSVHPNTANDIRICMSDLKKLRKDLRI